MRTALFFIAMSLTDVAVALGKNPPSTESNEFLVWGLVIFAIMDLVDFVRGKHG